MIKKRELKENKNKTGILNDLLHEANLKDIRPA